MLYASGYQEDAVRKLEDKLYDARSAVLELLTPELRTLAESYHRCADRGAFHDWEHRLVAHVLDSAWVIPESKNNPYSGPRAYCPLCKSGSSAPFAEGFAYPEGLERHLEGRGNTFACTIIKVLFVRAREDLYPKFRELEAAHEAERHRMVEERRKAEPVFKLGPDATLLLDERIRGFSHGEPRTAESLTWAIQRLSELGFREAQSGNVRAFTKAVEGFIVYADPRETGTNHLSRASRPSVNDAAPHGLQVPGGVLCSQRRLAS